MSERLHFTAAPAPGPAFRRIIFGRRRGYRSGDTWPALSAVWPGARIEAARLEAYRSACSIPNDGGVPVLFPHVLVSGIHLEMLAHPAFPLKMLGAVHARNHVIARGRMDPGGAYDAECELLPPRVVKQGLEFDVATRLTAGGACVWESLSSFLTRGKGFGTPGDSPAIGRLDDLIEPETTIELRVPPGMGRRYGGITRDYNPIHISNLLARLFGFPRALVHGMWTAARSAAALPAFAPGAPVRYDVLFKGPVWVGSGFRLAARNTDDARRFDVFCENNPRPCVQGQLRVASPGATLTT